MALPDIVDVLGPRPYPFKKSVMEYLEELREREVDVAEEDKEDVNVDEDSGMSTDEEQDSETNTSTDKSEEI